ncbi:hypothetical protein BH11BAC3_BH11BAC3_07590 [soil metagenome]
MLSRRILPCTIDNAKFLMAFEKQTVNGIYTLSKTNARKKLLLQVCQLTCTCCEYSTTIYSDPEWMEATSELFCETYKGFCNNNNSRLIHRDDIDTEISLQMQFDALPIGKHLCYNDIPLNQLDCMELNVYCYDCNKDTESFITYPVDKNMLEFCVQCMNQEKLAHILLTWLKEAGHGIFIISGTGTDFSST